MRYFIITTALLICFSCHKKTEKSVSFYHWKAKAVYSGGIDSVLTETKTSTIYLHYFDVDDLMEQNDSDDGVYPVYVLTDVDSGYLAYNIVPVVFIANDALKQADINTLNAKIRKLVNDISMHNFGKVFTELQIDCDWTPSTQEKYFALLSSLSESYDLSATIRLHQIKYKEKTGIPPVKRGVLMLYNIGRLDDDSHNSILESTTVKSYINDESTYPLPLKVALPLFSQTVLKNNSGEIRLINSIDENAFTTNSSYFRKISDTRYEVLRDTLFHSFYLGPGYQVKLEKVTPPEIVKSYQAIEGSNLDVSGVIFYHLDDNILRKINPLKVINQL